MPPPDTDDALGIVIATALKAAVAPLVARVGVLEHALAATVVDTKELATLRERVAVLETRAPIAGPPGLAGKDGADGLGFEDLVVTHDGQRSVTFALARDGREKTTVVTFPCLIYRGVYALGHTYAIGDVVTHNGSAWHCQKDTTTKPDTPEGAGYWRLMVKRGDRGRDHREPVALGPIKAVR